MVLAVAGIPFLATFFASIFASIFSFFAKFVTRRVAVAAAFISSLLLLTSAFFLALVSVLSAFSPTLPTQYLTFVGHILPSNYYAYLSAYLSIRAIGWAYRWNVRTLQYTLFQ